jgi:hypothetical protein
MSSFERDIRIVYMRVPEFVYRALLNAESAGVFWNAVKDQFEYAKLN